VEIVDARHRLIVFYNKWNTLWLDGNVHITVVVIIIDGMYNVSSVSFSHCIFC